VYVKQRETCETEIKRKTEKTTQCKGMEADKDAQRKNRKKISKGVDL